VVVTCAPEDAGRLDSALFRRVGSVGGDEILGVPLAAAREAYERGLA
jgi:hypothetical protein